jgi:hypothetical protein
MTTPDARAQPRKARQDLRETRKKLRELTESVSIFLAQLDLVMTVPPTRQRDIKVGELAQALDVANDIALHFGLKVSFPAIKRRKEAARRALQRRSRPARDAHLDTSQPDSS